MTDCSDRATLTEEARIKSAYAKRCSGTLYSWFDPGHLFLLQELERRILAILRSQGMHSLRETQVLEVGCGNGFWLREFVKWGACPQNITGIDLLPDRISRAKALCPQRIELQCENAASLPFQTERFDLVLQATVFTSVLDFEMKRLMAREMLRVLKDDGVILWYDYHWNNPRNPDVRGIGKREIAHLFPQCRIELHRATLAPPAARLLARYSWLTCYALERLALFNTHYVGLILKH